MRNRYGESRIDSCPFCGKQGVTKNEQGLSVCINHKKEVLDIKCACGEWLDVKKGKFGAYFNCINCGNINLRKGLENNSPKDMKKKNPCYKSKELTVDSDQLDYLY